MEEEDKTCQVALERERWLIERARAVDVDPEFLLPPPRCRAARRSADSGLGWIGDEPQYNAGVEEEIEAEDEGIGDKDVRSFSTRRRILTFVQVMQYNNLMLVFGLSQLPSILDIHITSYLTHCLPLSRRSLPANALYLYARFAHYRCDETWLEELLESAVEKIEQSVYVGVLPGPH